MSSCLFEFSIHLLNKEAMLNLGYHGRPCNERAASSWGVCMKSLHNPSIHFTGKKIWHFLFPRDSLCQPHAVQKHRNGTHHAKLPTPFKVIDWILVFNKLVTTSPGKERNEIQCFGYCPRWDGCDFRSWTNQPALSRFQKVRTVWHCEVPRRHTISSKTVSCSGAPIPRWLNWKISLNNKVLCTKENWMSLKTCAAALLPIMFLACEASTIHVAKLAFKISQGI